MKFLKYFTIFILIALISCGTTKVESPVNDDDEVVEVFEDVTSEQEDVIEVVEVVEPVEEVDEEYLRSIDGINPEDTVSKEEFDEDKAAILHIISELSTAMEKLDFEKWKTYIAPESITYYSNNANLRKAQKKLPDKTIQLKGLRDYFRYVFIPSRKVSNVDEIRYISKTYIKAVQVREDNSTVVYYYFEKINGKWLVSLPEVS